jgi:hypothetical protein
MNDKAQRIAIAEACGYRKCDHVWEERIGNPKDYVNIELTPNYLSDLNAMHEAEKCLKTPDELAQYQHILLGICHPGSPSLATAAQRAEAFLKTIGKWK